METADVKLAFAARLASICHEMGLVQDRGRQTALALLFEVSPNAARKWLRGDGLPELETAIRIADWANVNVVWLLQGKGPKRGDEVDTGPGELLDAVKGMPNDDGQQVFDFIQYKMERSSRWFSKDAFARYMALLDRLKQAPKKDKGE